MLRSLKEHDPFSLQQLGIFLVTHIAGPFRRHLVAGRVPLRGMSLVDSHGASEAQLLNALYRADR